MAKQLAAVLIEARKLIEDRPYQTRFFAALDTGKLETYLDKGVKRQRPKWVMCSPMHDKAMLSMRGAIIRAAGSGALAWPVFEFIYQGTSVSSIDEPPDKHEAMTVLSTCIRMATRPPVRVEPRRELETV